MIIEAEDLRKKYTLRESGTLQVLDGVTFSLEQGVMLAVTGQSGSGKSTLISLLAGLDRPESGTIRVAGAELTSMSDEQLTRFRAGHIGIVFQQFHLMPHLSAEENITLPLELLHQPVDRERIESVLDSVGLQQRRHHLPRQLSGGECQRVAIARALVVEPIILLADEPTGNLDIATGREVIDLLFRLADEKGTTMIIVTHNQELASRCPRHLRLAQGVLR